MDKFVEPGTEVIAKCDITFGMLVNKELENDTVVAHKGDAGIIKITDLSTDDFDYFVAFGESITAVGCKAEWLTILDSHINYLNIRLILSKTGNNSISNTSKNNQRSYLYLVLMNTLISILDQAYELDKNPSLTLGDISEIIELATETFNEELVGTKMTELEQLVLSIVNR